MIKQLEPCFVDGVPETLESGRLYVSIRFKTTSHLCACGCGERVVAKLSPHDWNLLYDGKHITLSPSIGNWSFDCRSHYFVRKNMIVWAGDMSQDQIERGRNANVQRKRAISPPKLELPTQTLDPNFTKKSEPSSKLPAWLQWILFWK